MAGSADSRRAMSRAESGPPSRCSATDREAIARIAWLPHAAMIRWYIREKWSCSGVSGAVMRRLRWLPSAGWSSWVVPSLGWWGQRATETAKSMRRRLSGETLRGVEAQRGPKRGGEAIGSSVDRVGQLVVEVGEAD